MRSVQRTPTVRPEDNGELEQHGDAHEPEAVSQDALDFNPAALEATEQSANATPDPFDPAALRLTQDLGAAAGVKKALTTVPVRKPDKPWFVRAHPDEGFRLATAVIESKEGRSETYLVHRSLWPELTSESSLVPRLLITAVNRQGVVFLWPVKLPGSDGRLDEWSRSAMEAANLAGKRWVRVQANMSLGAYEISYATGELPEPEWPEQSFTELLRIAFRDKFITSRDHPILRQLRGEV